MSGHSQFANIKHRKSAQDSKRSKQFVKIAKEITVAVKKAGPDINSNPALKAAIDKAKQNNMPKENYLRIIKKSLGTNNDDNYESIRYEAYGPGGVAFIVECLTDNKKRTASKMRSYFNKVGGSLGQTHSVLFMFEKKGLLAFNNLEISEDKLLEWIVESQAENFTKNGDYYVITTALDNFDQVKEFFVNKNINFVIAEISWVAKQKIKATKALSESISKLVEILDECEDVEKIYHNLEME